MKLKADPVSGIYYMHFWCRKARAMRKVSLRTKSESEARRLMRESSAAKLKQAEKLGAIKASVVNQLLHGEANVTVGSKVDEWVDWQTRCTNRSPNTINTRAIEVRAWIRYADIERLPVSSLTEEHIMPWVNRPGSTKASSRRAALGAVVAYCTYLSSKGYCEGNPALLVEVDESKLNHEQLETTVRQPITDDELMCLMLHAKSIFWQFALICGRITALRISDICLLEWANITEDNITRWTRKTDARVVAPLNNLLRETIKNLPREHVKWVFPSQRAIYLDPKARSLFSKQFERMCHKCRIVGKSFHSLRHAALTEVVNNGGTVEDAARLAGHASTTTTEGYIHAPTNHPAPLPDPTGLDQTNGTEATVCSTTP